MAGMKTWAIALSVGAITGAVLGAWAVSDYKDEECWHAIRAEARRGEDRVGQVAREVETLRMRVTQGDLQLDLARALVEFERRDYGLALDRLMKALGSLENLADSDSDYGRKLAELASQSAELVSDLQAGDRGVPAKLGHIYAELDDALRAGVP